MPPTPPRVRSIIEALAPLALGVLFLALGHRTSATLLGVLGGALLIAAVIAPWVGVALRRLTRRLGRRLAGALTWLLVAGVHLLVFTPAGLWWRLVGRDPLDVRFPGGQSSYWSARAPVDPARIRRTF